MFFNPKTTRRNEMKCIDVYVWTVPEISYEHLSIQKCNNFLIRMSLKTFVVYALFQIKILTEKPL